MYNRKTISDCFTGLVGWRDSANTGCIPALDTYNKLSNSGVYVDGVPGLRLETVYACMSKDFTADAIGFNAYLKRLFQDSLWNLIEEYLIIQKQRLNGKTIIANQELGYKAQNARLYVAPQQRFVGLEFKPWNAKNYCTELLYLGLWLKQAQSLNIYLYESQQLQPLHIFPVDYANAGSLQLFPLKEKLEPALRFITQGGIYYIGYYESDMATGNEAIDTRSSCWTCNNSGNQQQRKNYAPYIRVRPFLASSGHTYDDKTLFDIDALGFGDQTYGLTASINVTCDLSNLLCDNQDGFAQALQKRIAINAFWQIYHSKELGPQAELSKDDARLMAEKLEIDLQDSLKKLVMDFEDVNCDCIGSKKGSLQIMGM